MEVRKNPENKIGKISMYYFEPLYLIRSVDEGEINSTARNRNKRRF